MIEVANSILFLTELRTAKGTGAHLPDGLLLCDRRLPMGHSDRLQDSKEFGLQADHEEPIAELRAALPDDPGSLPNLWARNAPNASVLATLVQLAVHCPAVRADHLQLR